MVGVIYGRPSGCHMTCDNIDTLISGRLFFGVKFSYGYFWRQKRCPSHFWAPRASLLDSRSSPNCGGVRRRRRGDELQSSKIVSARVNQRRNVLWVTISCGPRCSQSGTSRTEARELLMVSPLVNRLYASTVRLKQRGHPQNHPPHGSTTKSPEMCCNGLQYLSDESAYFWGRYS